MRILLVEDDQMLGSSIQSGLMSEKYTVDWITDGKVALDALVSPQETFDAVVLDIGLPSMSGIDVLKEMRKSGNKTPVVILTAFDSITDKVSGLDSGADDYLIKPFSLDELVARLRALIRRSGSGRAEPLLNYGMLSVDPAAHMVYRRGRAINISPKEFVLLHKMLENAGKVLTREQLAQTLYGWENEIGSNAVEVHIHNLRQKLGVKLIRTIRGIGYMIDRATS